MKSKFDRILFLLIIVAAILRIVGSLTAKSLYYDEVVVWEVSNLSWFEILNGSYYPFRFHPPLFYLLIKFWGLVSQDEIWLRLPSVGASILTTYFLFRVVKKILNHNTAYFSAFLFATSTFHIFWSNQLRVYPILFLF